MGNRHQPFPERFGGGALVTGASSGIGEAFARSLAARGMDLLLVARRGERLQALAAEIARAHRVRTVVAAADLARPEATERLAKIAAAEASPVGLLVLNAGFGSYGPFEAEDPARALDMVDLNCRSPVALTHAFLPAMLARGRGGIVIVASTAGYQPTPFLALYGATKAFDLMLAEALWAELRPRGIEVLGLSPGYTRTEFHDAAGAEGFPSRGRPATAEEVVATALASLGRRPSVVCGRMNALRAWAVRLLPRKAVALLARWACAPRPVVAARGGGRRE